ncbi:MULTISPECIES: DUF4282 domain-containing protein [Henriciella]|jgi:hypothetical protein|uniref:DUF4282 domain-containing protein n=1 Tax=Henriciella pelagia TaxID=1977912 RepID=A0ABQ1JQZ8_9PROT|nr:DUF4282 domain-containing protein [Henriciella pelagia]GGB72884.1 hypothetical protein GCM10011503_21930 [Henriciella pelagia]
MDGLLGRFLSFDKMITGTIVKFLYYILLALVILGGIFFLLQSLFSGNFGMFLGGLILLPLAIIYVRMICEMFLVIFRISDNLAALRQMKENETK